MLCNYPWRHQMKDGSIKILPCGNCLGCKIAHSREWAFRIMAELRVWKCEALFLTLTYNNENLPQDCGLHKDHLQKFWKRLRKELGERKIKYFACGEYGDKFQRPHYHAIVFGVSFFDKQLIQDCWPFGFVGFGTVTYDSARYVAGYIDKKFGATTNKKIYGELQPPFQCSSQGIGYEYFLAHRKEIESIGITLNGHKLSIPRYFIKKFEIKNPNVIDYTTDFLMYASEQKKPYLQLLDEFNQAGRQNELTKKAKKRMFEDVRTK